VTVPRGISLGRLWLALLLAIASPCLKAQGADSAWFVRVWKTGEGFAGDYVGAVAQTNDGFLWILAGGQLERFDGVKLRRFAIDPVAGSTERRIREFLPTRGGGFAFVSFDHALVQVVGQRQETLATDLPRQRMESMFEDSSGFLLVYGDTSVWRCRNGKLTELGESDGLPAGPHCRFVTDRSGRVWFTKGDHVGMVRGDRFETLATLPGDPHVAACRDGGVWVAAGSRLLRYDVGGPMRPVAVLPLKNISVRPNIMLEDHTGAVWIGTYDRGLFRYGAGGIESVPVSHREIVCLAEDREGSIWAGTSGGGLDQLQPRAVTIEGGEAGLAYAAVLGLAEDIRGTLWGFTQAGLLKFRREGAWQSADTIPTGGRVNAVAAAPDGALWIATRNDVLHRWRDGKLTTWTAADGIAGSADRRLIVARNGDVWLANSRPGVLQRLRGDKLERVALPIAADLIRSIVEDSAGDIWVAINGHRLVRITAAGVAVDESARIAAVERPIRVLLPADDGTLWIGYDQGGVGRLKNGSFVQITAKAGLLYDNIEVALTDGRGWLWLATPEAIFKVREAELTAYAEGRLRRVQPVRIGEEQGVRPTFGESIGPLRRRDGKLWIPMATSLAIIDPAQERSPADPPPVWITEVRVDDRPVAAHPEVMPLPGLTDVEHTTLRLAPGHRRLDLDFTALSFRTPSNVRFRYRLEGFDDSWIEAGTRRTASYSRLAAGDYRFRVRACNSDGVWNEVGATAAFTVAPFFWETWWFRLAVIGASTAAIFAVARYIATRRLRLRLRAAEQEAAVERERARIARDIHDDLGSRLTKIVLLSGLAARDRAEPDKTAPRVQEISDTARQLLRSLDETVWAVNPRNDTLPHFISYVGQFAVNFLRTAEIECILELPDDPPDVTVSAEVRHHLYLAVKETLTNVVRHARATTVTLRVALSGDELKIVVSDNGCGFAGDPSDPEADGLQNMRERMARLEGVVNVVTEPGVGTRVTFTLPRVAALGGPS
jgi:signal transduction histidine kinase/ligand-binding sensor domain-containing protein